MDRIDAALARLEGALSGSSARVSALSLRHEALKSAVGEALGQIDALVARHRG